MNQGFTLIELLVVVLIVGILSAVALPQYQTAVERSRATEALTQMHAVRTAMERYHAQRNAWPTSFNKLDVDIPCTSSSGGSCSDYGGKYFSLSFSGNGNSATVTAARRAGVYTLTTEITAGDYAYTAVRSCTSDGSDDGVDYCNAITGGNTDDF